MLSAEQWRPAAASFEEFVRQRVSAPKLDPRDPDIKATWFSEEARKQFESLRVQDDIVAERITYASEGLAIDGYRIAPIKPDGRCPVVIWGRGGNNGDGVISEWDLIDLAGWARRGWVVIASNYRGAPGSEGRDEFGGADVADQLNAIAVARTVPCADMRNVFMFGRSRGGLMTYRAIAAGAPVRAAATIGGAADLSEAARDRPDLAPAMRQIMPDYDEEAANRFCRRSAVCWPEKITVPLLLMHGQQDWRVPTKVGLDFAQALQRAGRPYELRVYWGEDHQLSGMRDEAHATARAFFERHMAE